MVVVLFDVDGTLTYPMKPIESDVIKSLQDLKSKGYNLSVVGGSDYKKISEQLGETIYLFDNICSENGLVTHTKNEIVSLSLIQTLGETAFQDLINTILSELSRITIPIKRDRFIEVRKACINVSPIGRSCSYEERIQFNHYDMIHKIRHRLIENLTPILKKYNLKAAIGGMISIDIYPVGWDKTYSLNFFHNEEKIHFFGDKTDPGGNDYELFINNRVTGHTVIDPKDLINKLSLLFP